MRLFFIQILLISTSFSFSQDLSNGMTFYLNQDFPSYDDIYTTEIDSSYHVKYVSGKYQIFAKDSSLIFEEKFVDYPSSAKNGFFKAKTITGIFIFNPAKKFIKRMAPTYEKRSDFNSLTVLKSSLTGEFLLTLKDNLFLNFSGKIISERDMYYETPDENKQYKIITNIDEMVMDYIDGHIKPEEYDEYTKEQFFLYENQNPFFKTFTFDLLLNSYDGYDAYTSVDKYSERLYHVRIKNKKEGVVSNLGHFVLEPKYEYIEFYESENYLNDPLKYIAIKAYIGKTCFVYNVRGELVFQSDFLPRDQYIYPSPYEIGYDHYFTGYALWNKKKSGLIHDNGQVILPPIFDNYDYYDFDKNLIMNCPKNLNLSTKCEKYEYKQYYIGFNNSDKIKHFYAPNGQFLNKIEYDFTTEFNRNGFLSFDLDGLAGLIGPGACLLKKAEFESISIYQGQENIFIGHIEDKCYFFDGKGNRMFDRDFSNAYFVDTNYAVVDYFDGESYAFGLLDIKKSLKQIVWKIKPEYSFLNLIESTYIGGKKVFEAIKDVKYGVIDENNEVLIDFVYNKLYFHNLNIISVENRKYGLHNYDKTQILENKYDSISNLNLDIWSVEENDKFAFYSLTKKEFISKFVYDKISVENTISGIFYFVKENGKWGVLNSKFEKLVDSRYELIKFDYISQEFECLNENKQIDCFFVK